jgi:phasin
MNQEPRRFAATTTTTAREAMQKGAAAAEGSTRALGGYFAAAEAVRDFNMKLIEIAQANTMATLNFAQEVATAKAPTEAAALWSSHARKNFETLTDQSKQLTALAQRIVTSTAGPLTNSFTQTLQGST